MGGNLEEAEHIFRQLFADFRERDLHEELVFLALDLADTYVAEGQYASAARFHLVAPLFFDIGGRQAPISIRDQMVRGRMAVDRAIEEGLIGPRLLHQQVGTSGYGVHSSTWPVPLSRCF